MEFTPKNIYKNYIIKNYNNDYVVNLFKIFIDFSENDFERAECIEILRKIKKKNKEIFYYLENLVVSDSNEIIISSAIKVLKKCFLNNSLRIFEWVLNNDSSISCKIIVLKALEKINNFFVKSILIKKINEILKGNFIEDIKTLQTDRMLNRASCKELFNILINYFAINYIKNKLNNICYKFKNGLVVELDLTKVYSLNEAWRYKGNIIAIYNFEGIKYLKDVKKLKCLSLENSVKNDYAYFCELILLKSLKIIKNDHVKKFLLFQINKIQDEVFKRELQQLQRKLKLKTLEKLPKSILVDILINYLTLLYFLRRYKNLKYEVKNGFIVKLVLERTKLIKLTEFIDNLSALKVLKLNYCSIYKLPESIGNLKLLEILELEGNNLRLIPKSLDKLHFLRKLNLRRNQIKELPLSFNKMYNLQYLDLAENSLVKIPKSITNLRTLKFLDLSKNNIIKLPQTFGNLHALEKLNCSFNKIESLPINLGKLIYLCYLNLDSNCLIDLPESIANFKSLRELHLAENRLSRLPENIGSLTLLEKLDISWNKLVFLPNSIGFLKKLKNLNLTHNKLIKLPYSIGYLPSLINLDLTWNNLTRLPNTIIHLKSLESLIIYDNELTYIPESISSLQSLKYLNLCSNNLYKLPDSIKDLINLKKLTI